MRSNGLFRGLNSCLLVLLFAFSAIQAQDTQGVAFGGRQLKGVSSAGKPGQVLSTTDGEQLMWARQAPRLVPVCSRTMFGTPGFISNGTDTVTSYRTTMFFPSTSSGLRFVLFNGSSNSSNVELGPGNAVAYTAAIEYGGSVKNINITNASTGLADGTYSLTFAASPVLWGTNATGTCTVSGGQVVSADVTCSGSFYTSVTPTLPGGGSATFTATLSGVVVSKPATFNRATSVTLAQLESITTDVFPGVVIPAGTTACARISVTVTAGQFWYACNSGTLVDSKTVGSDTTTSTGAMTTTAVGSQAALVSPSAVLGNADGKSVVVIGDSITNGTSDTFGDPIGLGNTTQFISVFSGYSYRALRDKCGYIQFAIPSTRLDQWATISNVLNRSTYWANAQIAYLNLGVNDLGNSRTFDQVKQDYTALTSRLHSQGLKVVIGTICPNSASTDGWRTLNNQTPAAWSPARVQLNRAIRNLAFGHDSYVDIASAIESSPDSGKWKIQTIDYLNGQATSGTTSSLVDLTKSWTTNQWAGCRCVIKSGAQAGRTRVIQSNTGTQLNFNISSGLTLPGAIDSTSQYVIDNGMSLDGTHPASAGHAAMADMLILQHKPTIKLKLDRMKTMILSPTLAV